MTALPVTLREVTADSVRAVIRLETTEHQKSFVAPNATSIAQAYFEPKAWFRAIYAGDDPVGFVMTYEDPDEPQYFLWRLMIDAAHQGKGYGRAAMLQLIDRVRGLPGATRLLTSYVPGEGSPMGFYHSLGFVDTGDMEGDEVVTALAL